MPKPKLGKGKPIGTIFQQRKTTREIGDKKLSLQMISNILWAACGVNRKKGPFGIGGRTAATASNSQEIDLYIAMKDAVYLYNANNHALERVVSGDFRDLAIGKSQPGYTVEAPLHILYTADIDKLANTSGFKEPGLKDPEVQKAYYYVDTGIIAGNIYVVCAAFGLASWFHNCNKRELGIKLPLRKDQRILFAQTVGYAAAKRL